MRYEDGEPLCALDDGSCVYKREHCHHLNTWGMERQPNGVPTGHSSKTTSPRHNGHKACALEEPDDLNYLYFRTVTRPVLIRTGAKKQQHTEKNTQLCTLMGPFQ